MRNNSDLYLWKNILTKIHIQPKMDPLSPQKEATVGVVSMGVLNKNEK